MTDLLKTDLRLEFRKDGSADLALGAADLDVVSGRDNLRQALLLRLLVDRGELAGLGHPRYGSHIRELIGEIHDQANRELLRRYVRKSLAQDPRVEEVVDVTVSPHPLQIDTVEILAVVQPIEGEVLELETNVHAG